MEPLQPTGEPIKRGPNYGILWWSEYLPHDAPWWMGKVKDRTYLLNRLLLTKAQREDISYAALVGPLPVTLAARLIWWPVNIASGVRQWLRDSDICLSSLVP